MNDFAAKTSQVASVKASSSVANNTTKNIGEAQNNSDVENSSKLTSETLVNENFSPTINKR